MATLQQFDPTAKVYPKHHFDYGKTRIGMTQLAASTQEHGRDEVLADPSY